jgi:coenzyme F420 hydrogenase subunit beta
VNIESEGIRPRFDLQDCAACTECLSICPGYRVDAGAAMRQLPKITEADHEFGPALEIWEGYATDPEIRFFASSGGLLSALSLYCLEHESMEFVLHTGMDEEHPWLNKTVQSRNRSDLLKRTGSRYAPSSPCEGLEAIEQSDRPCVFVGKPCDTSAVWMLRQRRPELDQKLGLVLTFFCAGTPSTRGTLDLASSLNITTDRINTIRYRGEGWPGQFTILYDNGSNQRSLTYTESWGRLTSHRPLRCNLCPDGLGRVADISCGDAWESYDNDGDPGRSIVVVRTARGREILHRAMEANYVTLTPVAAAQVLAAQPNLLERRRELFGRLLGLRSFLIPIPKFTGFSLFRSWMHLSVSRKARTVLGTAKRIMIRGLWHRRSLSSSSSALNRSM